MNSFKMPHHVFIRQKALGTVWTFMLPGCLVDCLLVVFESPGVCKMFGADPTHVSVNFPYKPFLGAGAVIHELFMKSPVVILQLCFSLKLLHTVSTD